MCGGEGSRLESPYEKPLHPIDASPMVDRVIAALEASRVGTIYAAVSPNAPETRAHLERVAGERTREDESEGEREYECESLTTIETPGGGYVADLLTVLERDDVSQPVLTVAADLPLLEGTVVDRVLDAYDERDVGGSLTVCVPVALKERLDVSVGTRLEGADHLAPTGVNVVGGGGADADTNTNGDSDADTDDNDDSTDSGDDRFVSDDPRLAVNVNRIEDARLAETQL